MPFSRRMALELFVRGSVHRAARVIAISEFGRNEIIRGLGVRPDRVDVTYLAAGNLEDTVSGGSALKSLFAEHGVRRPYMVAFSSHGPNKNIPNLLHAFERARNEHKIPHQLMFVGHPPREGEALSLIERLRNEGSVVFCGYLDRALLRPIFSEADLFVFPSLYEGFGIPVLEAMTAGVPVACSKAGPLPEVAGLAARYFDPQSVSEMSRVLAEIAQGEELRKVLRNKGIENAKRFSWEKTARDTHAVYDRVIQRTDNS
jgi:glycosyltransferase involved in cell wall biosynthesis